jgi:hypothetical protein
MAAASLALTFGGAAFAQSDNFNDGNDTGWQRYDPIGTVAGPIATFSFPNGGYRIQTTPSPAPSTLGPGRAGALRTNVYTDFYVAVDVVDWNPALNQAFGVLARVREVGLGQTDGYAFTWDKGGGDLDITRIVNENPSSGGGGGVPVNGNDRVEFVSGRHYRLVFLGKGTQLTGRVYELPNDNTPVAEITGSDANFADGISGLVIYDNTSTGTGATDVTFDNYVAYPEEPPRIAYNWSPGTAELILSWPSTFEGYVLESSPVLPATQWDPEEYIVNAGGQGFHVAFFDLMGATGNKFFRLRKPLPAGAGR